MVLVEQTGGEEPRGGHRTCPGLWEMEHKEPRPSRSRCPPQPDSAALKRPLWPLPGDSRAGSTRPEKRRAGLRLRLQGLRRKTPFPGLMIAAYLQIANSEARGKHVVKPYLSGL